MKKELDPLRNGRIKLLGPHQLTITGIRWVGEPTDEEYAAARALDNVVQRVQAWMEGDLTVEWVRRQQHVRPGIGVRTLLAEYTTISGGTMDAVQERYNVAKTFALLERSTALEWSHHRVVWAHGGEFKSEQMKWLRKAEHEQWTVRALSAAIMEKKEAGRHDDTPQIPSIIPPELMGAIEWVSGRFDEVDSLTPEQAATRAAELDPVVEYHARCRARAGAPGKESIQPTLQRR